MTDLLLITGPPASGKSHAAVERFLAIPQSVLLLPTATMAEHVRNELARAGAAIRPSRIITLAQFLESRFVPSDGGAYEEMPAAAAEPIVHLLIEKALERLRPKSFGAVAEFRGFVRAVAAVFEEISAGAASPGDLLSNSRTTKAGADDSWVMGRPPASVRIAGGPFGDDLLALFREVDAGLASLGLALRGARLRAAAARIRALGMRAVEQVVVDGFFTLAPAELEIIEALAAVAAVTVTLPDCSGADVARTRLRGAGFEERRLITVHRAAKLNIFSAATIEQEIEEIARRILDESRGGRPFREMGIILRSRDPYGPALETTLARFGIPARFYFADPLLKHPVVRYLSGIVDALLGGWDHAALLALLRMPVSGVGVTASGDRFDFALRERLPGAGLPIRGLEGAPAVLDAFADLNSWRRDRVDAVEWASHLKTLRSLLPLPAVVDEASREQARIWRSGAAALDAFDAAMDATAAAFVGNLGGATEPAAPGRLGGSGLDQGRSGPVPLLGNLSGTTETIASPMSLAEFWRQARVTLALEPLRVADRRRNAVRVMDVFEARQWELPVVFICGLIERHFPQYHRQDPLLSDAVRLRAGLRTSVDRQAEERFLFELALTRATGQTILSHARFNEKGEEALPSFFLADASAVALVGREPAQCAIRIRPKPRRAAARAQSVGSIQDSELLQRLSEAHKRLSPTSIESFLQCPFQFFAGKTLRLKPRPAAPRDRMDLLVQGSILHEALAELSRMPVLGVAVFDAVFAQTIERARIPRTYRTEAVRLELLRHFEAFLEDRRVKLGWASRVEEQFRIPLNPLVTISGRIDRLDVSRNNEALVVDYKYSAEEKIRERIKETTAGSLVQGGLYLLAAERQFGLKAAGMLYCGLRKQVSWEGWHVPVSGLDAIGESTTPAALRDLMDTAARTALEVHEAITSGRIAVQPSDRDKCAWCDFRDICRVETGAAVRGAGSA